MDMDLAHTADWNKIDRKSIVRGSRARKALRKPHDPKGGSVALYFRCSQEGQRKRKIFPEGRVRAIKNNGKEIPQLSVE